jgi:hypothetical protein
MRLSSSVTSACRSCLAATPFRIEQASLTARWSPFSALMRRTLGTRRSGLPYRLLPRRPAHRKRPAPDKRAVPGFCDALGLGWFGQAVSLRGGSPLAGSAEFLT